MEKVAIYARISTDNLGQDVDRQLHDVRDYCQRMGYEIAEEYVDEGFARTTRNRPALDDCAAHYRADRVRPVDDAGMGTKPFRNLSVA